MHVKRPSTGFERGRLTFALKNITFADSFTPGEHTCAQQNVTAYGNDMPVRSPYMKLGELFQGTGTAVVKIQTTTQEVGCWRKANPQCQFCYY